MEEHTRGLLGELSSAVEELLKENRALRSQVQLLEQKAGVSGVGAATGHSAADRLRGLLFKTHKRKPVLRCSLSGTLPECHKDLVWEVCTAGGMLVSASADRTARVHDLNEAGRCAFVYRGHKGSVNSARFSPTNQKLVCTASGDLEIHIFRLPEYDSEHAGKNAIVSSLKHNYKDDDEDVIFSNSGEPRPLGPNDYPPRPEDEILDEAEPSSARIDSISNKSNNFEDEQDESLKVKRLSSVPNVFLKRDVSNVPPTVIELPIANVRAHTAPIVCADWITSGEMLASASWDSNCLIWSVGNGELTQVQQLKGHEDRLTGLDTLVDMKVVLTSSSDRTFRLWDLRTESTPVSVFQGHSASVTSAVFGKSGGADIVASAGEDRSLQIWDMRVVNSSVSEVHCSSVANRLNFSPKSNLLSAPHDDGSISICSAEGEILTVLEQPESNLDLKYPVLTSCWSLDEQTIYTSGWDKKISSWKTVAV